jgi:nucleotide-binding universal stress UspA family protein
LELAYVRHAHEAESGRERLAEKEVGDLLEAAAGTIDQPDVPQHIVISASTPAGLRELALSQGADVIVFGSEYRTAPGSVNPQASARRMLDGGQVAIAIATAGLAERRDFRVATIAHLGEDGDPCALETAESIAAALGGAVAERATGKLDLVVVGSKPGTVTGRVTISAAAEYMIELSRCPVVVIPRGVTVHFGS